jgi:hypothetical protein
MLLYLGILPILPLVLKNKEHDCSVDIATSCGLDGGGSVPRRDKIFLFSIASKLAPESIQPPVQWLLVAIAPGIKRSGHETDRLHPSTAEARNDGIFPFPHMSPWKTDLLINVTSSQQYVLGNG